MKRAEFIRWIKRAVLNLKDDPDLIPHSVLSHGFMEWIRLLPKELQWRGKKTEHIDGFTFERYYRILYDRFFLLVKEEALADFSEDDKEKLKEAGWREYLSD